MSVLLRQIQKERIRRARPKKKEGIQRGMVNSERKDREEGSWLIKMDSKDCVRSIYRPRHRKRLPIARKFSVIWGA